MHIVAFKITYSLKKTKPKLNMFFLNNFYYFPII